MLHVTLSLFRAVEHPSLPETQDFVRVHSYQSRMVIRPHRSFDEVGPSVSHCKINYMEFI